MGVLVEGDLKVVTDTMQLTILLGPFLHVSHRP